MSEREGQSPVSPTPPSTAVPRGGFGNTRTIARNSVWIGLQVGFSLLVVFLTSIPIARTFGPEKLGYYNYIQWLASISGVLGSFGIPIATRKYMSEYLGRGEQGLARAVFFSTLRLQYICDQRHQRDRREELSAIVRFLIRKLGQEVLIDTPEDVTGSALEFFGIELP